MFLVLNIKRIWKLNIFRLLWTHTHTLSDTLSLWLKHRNIKTHRHNYVHCVSVNLVLQAIRAVFFLYFIRRLSRDFLIIFSFVSTANNFCKILNLFHSNDQMVLMLCRKAHRFAHWRKETNDKRADRRNNTNDHVYYVNLVAFNKKRKKTVKQSDKRLLFVVYLI